MTQGTKENGETSATEPGSSVEAQKPSATSTDISDVTIHPLVLLSAADHYHRVARGTRKRVVGILLGQVFRGKVDAMNSFAVPFEEDSRNPAVFYLDHNYLENMCAMFRKVNTKERIVGFYSTGPQIRPNDLRIHDIVQRYCKASPNSTITTPSVFCIIDVRPDRPDLPVTSYKVVEEVSTSTSSKSNGQRQVQRSFTHVPSLMGAMEAEEIGVEHLLRDINDPTVSTVAALIRGKTAGLATLTEKLVECKDYLQGVAASPKQANPEILANLQKILNLLPNLNQHDMIRSLAIKTNDMMMAIYLAALIRSVIALHDVVNNKIRYGEDGTERPVPETSKSEEKKDDASDKENKKSGSKQNSDGTAGETKEKK